MKSEDQLWQSFLKGDKKALSKIYLAYYNDLYRYGLKLSSNKEMVKDVIQDLFLKLWRNRHNLRPVQKIRPYLLKSMRNHIYDSLSIRKQVMISKMDPLMQDQIIFTEEDFNTTKSQIPDKLKDKLLESINKLTTRQKEIVFLRYVEDLDFESISLITGMKIQSIRNSLCRAMGSLRNYMK